MRRAFANKVDATAKPLIAYAKAQGLRYFPINGAIDGLLAIGPWLVLVDWKSKGGGLTDSQAKLVAEGWDIKFLSTPAQVDALIEFYRRLA